MPKEVNKSKSKSKDKDKSKEKSKDKDKDKKSSKSSKSKKSSRNASKDKISSKDIDKKKDKEKDKDKEKEESIKEVSIINKEPGQNNNLDFSQENYFEDNKNPYHHPSIPQGDSQKCEGCFYYNQSCYCQECKKYLCDICKNQIHRIPVNATHVIIGLNDMVKVKKLCYHHQNPLEFFCESCDEAICKQCQIIGPHNTNYHRIISIKEAFNKKYYQINKMKPVLTNKLSELNYYNNRVSVLIEKVNNSKKELARDIRAQYAELSEKIKDIEGKRNAVLSYETSQLQADANNIQDVSNYINDIQNKKGPNMINFLLQFPQLKNKMDRIIEKPLREKIDLSNLENYPNDLEQRHKKLEDFDKIKKSLINKDEEIWKILVEKKNKERDLIEKAKKKSQERIEEWIKLSDKYQKELKKYEVVCSFCGKYIDNSTINSDCEANIQFYLNFFFTKVPPPSNMINTGKHFFGEPVDNLNELLGIAENLRDKQLNEMNNKLKEEEKLNNENNEGENNNIDKKGTIDSINIKITESVTKQVNTNNIIESIDEKNKRKDHIKEELQQLSQRRLVRLNTVDNKNSTIINEFLYSEKFYDTKEIIQDLLNKVEQNNIDLLALLNGYDLDEDGFIQQNELELALNKITTINRNDYELLLQFYKLNECNKINIKELASKLTQEYLDKVNASLNFKK